ncbi:MAG: MOSC domain-containing protein [Dehalococcoidia bacterium]
MLKVAALYRYPVKGFTPEPCEALTVLDAGGVAGDRVLAFRFADAPQPDNEWSPKAQGLALINTPGLARLNLHLDTEANRLCIRLDGSTLADDGLDADGRNRIASAVAEYVLDLDESPLAQHPERLPLRLIGDGVTPRHQDSEAGRVTLHGRGSLAALSAAIGDPEISERRFRSNIAIEGLEAWEEQDWIGHVVRIGSVQFDVARPVVRCLATHANPETGERDFPVLKTLTTAFGQEHPTFAVALLARGPGEIHVGDRVEVIG